MGWAELFSIPGSELLTKRKNITYNSSTKSKSKETSNFVKFYEFTIFLNLCTVSTNFL